MGDVGQLLPKSHKLSYIHLLTPAQGIAQKLCLTAHFLKRKEEEYDYLRAEIQALGQELGSHHHAATPSPMVNERDPAQLEG